MTELLAPAGSLERLKWAAAYGADAVYFGMERFSLRSFAGNFTNDEAAVGLEYLHERGRQGFVTLNIYPFSEEIDGLVDEAHLLEDMGADAFIVADLGVMRAFRRAGIKTPVHVSTQANTTNAETILAYQDLGATRVNLARELSLERILDIQERLKGTGMETEVFVHGSVCFSYSGRCAISDYLTGRSANRGECTHPCRWQYSLVEEKRPGEYFPVFEDERGTYLFNCRDLAIFAYVRKMVEAGVTSFKIEGRMKNAHYLASVLPVYRAALDGHPMPTEEAWRRLGRVDNRGFSSGFIDGSLSPEAYQRESAKYFSTSVWLVSTTEETTQEGRVCRVKNTVHAGEELELLTPDGKIRGFRVPNPIIATGGRSLERANNQDTILLDAELPAYSVFRRVTE